MVSIDFLRQVQLFRGLNQEELQAIAEIMGEWECAKGQFIFKEGDESEVLYVVKSGEMGIQISTGLLVNHSLGKVEEGGVFGELGFIDREPRAASIKCTKHAMLLSITKDDFKRLGKQNPNIQKIIYKNIARVVAERLRKANQQLRELAGKDKTLAVYLPQQFIV